MELYHHLTSLAVFAVAAAFTPGPNNVLLMASGANYGFRRTVPHVIGTMLGFFAALLGVAFGLGVVFTRYPLAQDMLKLAGCIYLLYLAWRIATARRLDRSGEGRPFSIYEAAGFQLVNPKGWMVIISAMTAFTLTGEAYYGSATMVIVVFMIVTLGAASTWAGFGSAIGSLLQTDRAYRTFNLVMGLLTASAVVLLFV